VENSILEWQGVVTLSLAGGAFLLMALTRLSPQLVMLAVLACLSISGVLAPAEALAGFSNPGVITVAAMFVLAAGVSHSGGIDWLVSRVLGEARSVRAAMLRLFMPTMLMSGFLNNTPVVATFIPALHQWSRQIRIPTSKLMIPLSYAAMLGGTLTLIGTSTNLVVNGEYQSLTGQAGFSLFSITVVGLPVALAGALFMLLFFPRWLPARGQQAGFQNLREFTLEVTVAAEGPLVGKTVEQAGLRRLERIYLVEIERQGSIITAVPSEEPLRGGDRLVFAGDTEAVSDLLRIKGLQPSLEQTQTQALMENRAERRLVEAVVSPHCAAIGKSLRDARFRDRYGAVVLAVARNGERVRGNLGTIRLAAGDTLLLEARPAFVSRQRYNKDFLLVNDRGEDTPRHGQASLAWGILFFSIGLAGFGLLSLLNATLLGAALMLLSGCCTVAQAEKSLDLKVIVTIAAAFALAAALQKTGVADWMATNVVALSGGRGWLLLVLVYFSVSLLTETITNNAAALVMLPIVLAAVAQVGLDPEPFVLAIMMAASTSFATPLGYQTNLMVIGPGNYRFSDFLKVGLPMNLFVGSVTLVVLVLGWPLD